MKRVILWLVVLGVFVLGFAPAALAAQDDLTLAGTRWQLVAYGDPDAPTPVIEGSMVTLEFTADALSGDAGCNSYRGPYTLDGDRITTGPIVSTRRACADDAMTRQEQAYLAALQAAERVERAEDQLTIHTAEGQVLQFEAIPADALVGTRWQLVAYGDPDAPTPVIEDSEVTLEFQPDNTAVGSGGCNIYGTRYQVDDDRLTFSAPISTEIACPDVMEQEQAFFDALVAATRYEIDEDQLIIHYGDGQQLVLARVESDALVGTRWQLVAYGDPDAPEAVIGNRPLTLEFVDENQITGMGGCNGFGGAYEVDGDNIAFREIISTLMACAEDEVTEQEQVYFAALQSATRYQIADDDLTIWYDGGVLQFERMTGLPDTITSMSS